MIGACDISVPEIGVGTDAVWGVEATFGLVEDDAAGEFVRDHKVHITPCCAHTDVEHGTVRTGRASL